MSALEISDARPRTQRCCEVFSLGNTIGGSVSQWLLWRQPLAAVERAEVMKWIIKGRPGKQLEETWHKLVVGRCVVRTLKSKQEMVRVNRPQAHTARGLFLRMTTKFYVLLIPHPQNPLLPIPLAPSNGFYLLRRHPNGLRRAVKLAQTIPALS